MPEPGECIWIIIIISGSSKNRFVLGLWLVVEGTLKQPCISNIIMIREKCVLSSH